MKKIFNLSKPVYKGADVIVVSAVYSKNDGGYISRAEFCHMIDNCGTQLIGKAFCREYYQHDGDGVQLICAAGRKSAKREAEAEKYVDENAEKIARTFLECVKQKLSILEDVKIVE